MPDVEREQSGNSRVGLGFYQQQRLESCKDHTLNEETLSLQGLGWEKRTVPRYDIKPKVVSF